MGGSCQRTWEHAIPKTARPTGPRISVQFRPPASAEGRRGQSVNPASSSARPESTAAKMVSRSI